jgi:enoyl-[acyl-carrier protein] reductase II
MLYPNIEEIMKIIVEEGVKIVLHRQEIQNMDLYLKKNGITVVHVVSSTVFALKAQNAGVDAIVAEGFEAGGHNGRDETTTFTLPMVKEQIEILLLQQEELQTDEACLPQWYWVQMLFR